MAFEPNYEKIVSSVRKNLGVTQVVVEAKLPLNEGTTMVKVLCANAKTYISSSELVGKDVNFNGYVGFQVVYLDENNNPQGLDFTAEFRDRYSINEAISGTSILMANVVEVKYSAVDNGIKMVAIVEVDIDGIVTSEADALVGYSDNETFFRNETIEYSTFENVLNEKFEVMGEMEIKDSVQKILSVCPSAFIDAVMINDNYITLKGGINVNICYISDEERPVLRSYHAQLDYTQDVAGENVDQQSIVQSMLNVVLNDVKVTIAMDANSANVSLVVPLIYNGYHFKRKSSEIVTDLFNLENMMNINYQSVDVLSVVESRNYEEKISGSTQIDDTQPFIDEVTGVCCNNIVLTNSAVVDNNILIEGVASTTVLYFNREMNATNSVEVEIPFSLNLNHSDIPNGYTPSVNVAFGEILAKGRRGKEIDIEGKIFAFVDLYKTDNEAVISQVQMLDERILEDCALSIYIVKENDTIWDIAKEMNVSPDVILEQNPELELPLKAGDKVVIYKQKVVEF